MVAVLSNKIPWESVPERAGFPTILYVEISQWLGSRGAKLKVGCWVYKIKGGLNGAGHLTLSDGVGLKAWELYLIGGVTALLLPRKKREIVNAD